jgi:hypothetical protein
MTTTLSPVSAAAELLDDAQVDRPPDRPRGLHRLMATRPADPRWARPALVTLLAVTALLYLWGLGSGGWANSFYAAAVQAGTKSWKAFFFGSFDASNFITVDKPPAALWVMEISARIFGLNSWSLLVPQALEGVATVGILYATVKRWFGPAAGLIAGTVVALTPVAALMFRYNNPDALLVLLLVGAAYATTRALESGRTRWVVLAMALVGTGFITKMMQAFLVVPAIGMVYLVAGPPKLGKRIRQLLVGAVVLIVASGWWVTIVELIPARDRPYIGGSQNNNLFNLIFGYNGFGRITGSEAGSAASQWGATGWDRMFLPSFGSQISWLIPGSLILIGATLWVTRRAPRTDRTRAAVALWGGWLLVTGLLLSYAKGIIHPYYTVALAPAIGAVVAIGVVTMWRRRDSWLGRGVLSGVAPRHDDLGIRAPFAGEHLDARASGSRAGGRSRCDGGSATRSAWASAYRGSCGGCRLAGRARRTGGLYPRYRRHFPLRSDPFCGTDCERFDRRSRWWRRGRPGRWWSRTIRLRPDGIRHASGGQLIENASDCGLRRRQRACWGLRRRNGSDRGRSRIGHGRRWVQGWRDRGSRRALEFEHPERSPHEAARDGRLELHLGGGDGWFE